MAGGPAAMPRQVSTGCAAATTLGLVLGVAAGVFVVKGFEYREPLDWVVGIGGGGAVGAMAGNLFFCPAPPSTVRPSVAPPAPAPRTSARQEFCAGFSEGFKSVRGNSALVPVCPVTPVVPLDSTPFREGIQAGIAAAGR
jgi:hypothetical protein